MIADKTSLALVGCAYGRICSPISLPSPRLSRPMTNLPSDGDAGQLTGRQQEMTSGEALLCFQRTSNQSCKGIRNAEAPQQRTSGNVHVALLGHRPGNGDDMEAEPFYTLSIKCASEEASEHNESEV